MQGFLISAQRPFPKRGEAYLSDAKGPVKTAGNGLVNTKEAPVAHWNQITSETHHCQ